MKKSVIAILLILLLLLNTACGAGKPEETLDTAPPAADTTPPETDPTWMTLPADRVITAKQYFVYSCETEEFLTIAEDKTTRIYPASVTKLFTAYVALQYLNADQVITAGDVLNKVAAGSSVAEIKKGDTVPVHMLIAGMLLPSGNDAAYLLAEAAGRVMYGTRAREVSTDDAVARFVKEMNDQAKLLGMNGTHFANPDGIHSDEHYTTYADLAILGTLALEDPLIRGYAICSSLEWTGQEGTVNWKNTNALVDPSSEYYCAYCNGLKTGQTPYAGSCLLSAFQYKGQTLIIGVFGCQEVDDRFPDTLQLFTDAAANYK